MTRKSLLAVAVAALVATIAVAGILSQITAPTATAASLLPSRPTSGISLLPRGGPLAATATASAIAPTTVVVPYPGYGVWADGQEPVAR